MTSTNPLEIGETLAYETPDARFAVRLQRLDFTYTVTVENSGGFRVDELSRTFATEDTARLFAREVSKRLKDGATVAEVVASIQPAAELITAVTAHLTLVADAKALTLPQQRAILAANANDWIDRRQVSNVKTLYALDGKVGDLTRRGFTPTGLRLNDYGQRIRRALADLHVLAARTGVPDEPAPFPPRHG